MATYSQGTYSGSNYADFRPTYEPAFFQFLAKWAPNVDLAVDVGCGTGFATDYLASIVAKKVIGLDPSQVMIETAAKSYNRDNLEFKQGSDLDLADLFEPKSVDLITVAEAAHWFEYPAFFNGVSKVLKPGGKLVIFGYIDPHIKGYPQFHDLLVKMSYGPDGFGPHWDKGRPLLTNMYRDLEFPPSLQVEKYDPLNGDAQDYLDHPFNVTREQTIGQFISFLHTYSSYHNWKIAHPDDSDIIDNFAKDMEAIGLPKDKKVSLRWDTALYLVHKLS